jgi:AcrR family transcriptional regulator
LRAQQARQTRRTIVAAAAKLFVDDGYGVTTIDAIAAAAGVSRKTVFAAVGGKGELLKLAIEWAQVGDDEPVPLAERPTVRSIGRLTDPDEIIAAYVAVVSDIGSRVARLSQALIVAAGIDPDIKAMRDEGTTHRWQGAQAFVQHLANHGGIRRGLLIDDAVDIVWLHSDPLIYHRLVVERQWTPEQFTSWLHRTLNAQLTQEMTATS